MEIKVGNFAIYKFQTVAVVEILDFTGKLGKSVVFTYIACNKSQKEKHIVLLSELKPITKENIKALRKKYNNMISKCNMQLHAIDECEKYI